MYRRRLVFLVFALTHVSGLSASNIQYLFWEAIKSEDLSSLYELSAKGVKVNQKNVGGATPLTFAVEKGSFELLQALLSVGADINMPDAFHNTPLSIALEQGDPLLIKMLLNRGASASMVGLEGLNGIEQAVRSGSYHLVPELAKNNSLFYGGASVPNILKPLIMVYTHLNYLSESFFLTPFSFLSVENRRIWEALQAKDLERFASLLRTGADPNQVNVFGQTLLMACAGMDSSVFLKLLLRYTDQVGQEDFYGYTALSYAVFQKQEENVRLLIDAGSRPFEEGRVLETSPVFIAMVVGDQLFQLLFMKRFPRSNYDRVSKENGASLWIYAGAFNDLFLIQSFYDGKRNIDFKRQDIWGNDAMYYAISSFNRFSYGSGVKYYKLVEILRKAGLSYGYIYAVSDLKMRRILETPPG